jgi:hypothetical protein
MTDFNFCLAKKNKIYMELQDMMDTEELSMNNPDDNNKVFYQIKKLIENSNFFHIKDSLENSDKQLEQMMVDITEENKCNKMQGNTLLIYCDDDNYYEVLYLENLIDREGKDISQINEFASISNIFLEPIFNDVAIIKSGYDDNKLVSKKITIDDITNIMINNFYHKGVIINEDGLMEELVYSGDTPASVVGHKFLKSGEIEVLGLILVPWIEASDNINTVATQIFKQEIKGRVFVCLATDVFDFVKDNGLEVNQTLNVYFPYLCSQGKLKELNPEIDNSSKYDNYNNLIDFHHKIYEKADINQGITSIFFVLYTLQPFKFPIEIFFKLIQTRLEYPFIKLNGNTIIRH